MLIKAIPLFRLRAVSDFLFAFFSLITLMVQAPVGHFKTIYWHTSDFLPTVLVHLRLKRCLSEYSRSRPFWHILCVFDRLDAPEDQTVICLSVLERAPPLLRHAHSHTHTHFSLGNSVSCADCTFNVLSNMSRNLATVKTAFYNNHRLSWFWR